VSKATVRRDDLVTYERMAEIVGESTENGWESKTRQLLRRWRQRGHITPVRDDLILFSWAETRPILAKRLGKPADAWADEPAQSPG